MINQTLAEKQGLSKAEVEAVEKLHKERQELFDYALGLPQHILEHQADYIQTAFTALEYELQEAWGFNKDSKYHRFWSLPKCTCPKMDNEDAWPSGRYYYSVGCVYHGG